MKNRFLLLIFYALLAISCFTNGEKVLGNLKIQNYDDFKFRVYQSCEIDFVQAVSLELMQGMDSIIIEKTFLFGTADKNNDLSKFSSASHDSIICLIYGADKTVHAIYDLKTEDGFPIRGEKNNYNFADSLLSELEYVSSKLIPGWK